MSCYHSLKKTINKIEELSRRLNYNLEPMILSKRERALYLSTCWSPNHSTAQENCDVDNSKL